MKTTVNGHSHLVNWTDFQGPVKPRTTGSPTTSPVVSKMLDQLALSNRAAGINLPAFSRHTDLSRDPAGATIVAEFTRGIATQLKVDTLSTVLSDKGRLFIGLPRKHAHPNCGGDAIECAIGIAAASGHHSFPIVATYNDTAQKPPFSGPVLERLAEHSVPGGAPMKVLHVRSSGEDKYLHSQLLPFPGAGKSRPVVEPRELCAYKKYDVALIQPGGISVPENFLNALAQDLVELLPNSTADGKTRPGRKRHAAAVFTEHGDTYFGVNLRSDVGTIDRCAEWNALSAALVGGHTRIAGTLVYSPDYDEGKVCCCGRCLDSLGDFMSPELGDMFVVYMSSDRRIEVPTLYSTLRPTSYAQAESSRARAA